jgi:hypothetical protein
MSGPLMDSINRLNAAAKRADEAGPVIDAAKSIIREAIDGVVAVFQGTGSAPLSVLGPFTMAMEHLDEARMDVQGAANAARTKAGELGKATG